MNTWLTIRTFLAAFLVLLGIGYMFVDSELRIFFGAAIAAFGLTFLLRLWVAARMNRP